MIDSIQKWFGEVWPVFVENLLKWLGSTGMSILNALGIMLIGFWVSALIVRIIRGMLRRSKVDESIRKFVCSCIKITLRIIVIVMAIATLGLNVTSIITALGAAGITVGLAMQDSLSNFASGVLILFNKPFIAGDYVEIGDSGGTVKEISLMYTTLINPENKQVVYPNAMVAESKVINHTALGQRRIDMQFRIGSEADIDIVKTGFSAAVESSPYAIAEDGKKLGVGIREFGCGYVVYDLRIWIKTPDYWNAYYDIQERVYRELARRDVELPREQMEVKLNQR